VDCGIAVDSAAAASVVVAGVSCVPALSPVAVLEAFRAAVLLLGTPNALVAVLLTLGALVTPVGAAVALVKVKVATWDMFRADSEHPRNHGWLSQNMSTAEPAAHAAHRAVSAWQQTAGSAAAGVGVGVSVEASLVLMPLPQPL